MVSVNNKSSRPGSGARGFTLIELLVVIAIIALLAAIIFPVFATVQENARQNSAMSNMHDISTKMEQYKLDTQSYPPVLFGYAMAGVSMDKVLGACTAAGSCSQYLQGLYPEYVQSWTEFEDPNDKATLSASASPNSTYLCGGTTAASDVANACTAAGQLVIAATTTPPLSFYSADAYDTSPQVTSANTISASTLITRYETSWTSISDGLDCLPPTPAATPSTTAAYAENFCYGPANPNDGAGDANNGTPVAPNTAENQYLNQLRWHNPPSNTFVTCSTYHVPQAGIVLVLTQDGSVKKIDAAKFAAFDKQTAHSIDANGVDAADFWKIEL